MKVKISDLGNIITGNTPSKKIAEYYDSNDICFVKPDSLSDKIITILRDTSEYISENARAKARIVEKDAVLVTCIGSIGKIGLTVKGEYAFNQQINAILPNNKILPKYLAYNLLFNKNRIIDLANAPVVPIINKTQFGDFEIKIETDTRIQDKIVQKLDKVLQIINQRQQELDKLDELVKARFVEMFGDVTKNEKKWNSSKLSELCSLKSGGTPTRQHPEYFEGTIPWITTVSLGKFELTFDDATEYITEEAIYNSATKIIPANSLLFGIRVGVGKVSKNLVPMCTNQDIMAITEINENNINLLFLKSILDAFSSFFNSQKRGATIQGIKSETLKSIDIVIPPIELQNQFATFVKQIDKSKLIIKYI